MNSRTSLMKHLGIKEDDKKELHVDCLLNDMFIQNHN